MRTFIYVDGFNLYYGALKGTPYKWLDLEQLCKRILPPKHQIASIVYCTARLKRTPAGSHAADRQRIYLKALQVHIPRLKPVYGYFRKTTFQGQPVDPRLGQLVKVFRWEEKGSDVNLAVHLVNDAKNDEFDCAVVISNDGDLAEALRIAKDECHKVVGLITPGQRPTSKNLAKHADFQKTARAGILRKSQLPSPIPGTQIFKPAAW